MSIPFPKPHIGLKLEVHHKNAFKEALMKVHATATGLSMNNPLFFPKVSMIVQNKYPEVIMTSDGTNVAIKIAS